jgi:hypothetical protein
MEGSMPAWSVLFSPDLTSELFNLGYSEFLKLCNFTNGIGLVHRIKRSNPHDATSRYYGFS